MFLKFTGTKEDTLWYCRTLVTTYRPNPAHNVALVDRLDRTVAEMKALSRSGDS